MEEAAEVYRKYILRCMDLGMDHDFFNSMRYDKNYLFAFSHKQEAFLQDYFELDVENIDLFVEAMNELHTEYEFDEVMNLVKYINPKDAFEISLHFIEYKEVADIPNRFICDENMKTINALFPDAEKDETIKEILKIKRSDISELVYEDYISNIEDIEHRPVLNYVYDKLDDDEIKECILSDFDESLDEYEYEQSEELLMTSLNVKFPKDFLETAFKISINENVSSIFDWYWIHNPNLTIRDSYLKFIINNEEKFLEVCKNENVSILEFILGSSFIKYDDVYRFVSKLKNKESIALSDESNITEIVQFSKYKEDTNPLIELIEKRYNELSNSSNVTELKKPTQENKEIKPKNNDAGQVNYSKPKNIQKCRLITTKASSNNSEFKQKRFKNESLTKTESQAKESEIVFELNQAKTRIVSKQLIKLTSQPIKSFLLSKNINSKLIHSFIHSNYFNSIVGAVLFAAGNKTEFENKKVERLKTEVLQEIKIESIASFGNEVANIVKSSIVDVINKFDSKNETKNTTKTVNSEKKRLSSGKKPINKTSENKKVVVKNK